MTPSTATTDPNPPELAQDHPDQTPQPSQPQYRRIQVSREKRPLNFFVTLSKKFLQTDEVVELSGLGLAVTTVVTIAEILRSSGFVYLEGMLPRLSFHSASPPLLSFCSCVFFLNLTSISSRRVCVRRHPDVAGRTASRWPFVCTEGEDSNLDSPYSRI